MKEQEKKEAAMVKSVELIGRELEKIKADDIRNFTIQALMKVDEKFWTLPASSTGKYHPEEDNGDGGLVRHVVKAVAVAEEFARRAKFTERELDMAISGVLLHDTCKNGVVWGEYTDYTHGIIAADWLSQFELVDEEAKAEIIQAVRFHMAPWNYVVNPFEKRDYSEEELKANEEEIKLGENLSRVSKAVNEADYWASRKSMSFFPGKTIDWE